MNTRILIVDQHDPFRRDLARYLISLDAGYDVVGEAASDAGARERVAHLQPDVVLLDLDLPDRNGLLTAQHIRQAWPATAVIVVSHHRAGDYRQAALAAGAVAYVDKLTVVETLPVALAAARTP